MTIMMYFRVFVLLKSEQIKPLRGDITATAGKPTLRPLKCLPPICAPTVMPTSTIQTVTKLPPIRPPHSRMASYTGIIICALNVCFLIMMYFPVLVFLKSEESRESARLQPVRLPPTERTATFVAVAHPGCYLGRG